MPRIAELLLKEAVARGEYEPSGYPEHDKLHMVKEHSQAIGEFLDFGSYTLCEEDPNTGRYWPVQKSIQTLLAEWYGIDEQKLNDEKEAMLASLRAG